MRLPPGFAWRHHGADTLLVRADLGATLEPVLSEFLDGRLRAPQRRLAGGRGDAVAVDLGGGLSAVLRRSMRGGLPAWVLRDVYFGFRFRPFREVMVAEELRRRGVAVPEYLGAIVRRAGWLYYRGAVATREVPAARNLWEHLRDTASIENRRAACAAAGRAVAAFHAAGGVHPDLNLENFLVAVEGKSLQVLIIDCDRVRVVREVSDGAQHRAWRRLQRSARRLDPQRQVTDPAWLHAPRSI